jgi:hypothetical protein
MKDPVVQRTFDRLKGEFLEMPGLRLTLRQASRFCALEESTCKALLDALVEAKFLSVRSDGTYGIIGS